MEQVRAEANRHPVGQAIREYGEAMQDLWLLRRADLDREVGASVVDRMLVLLGTRRGLEADAYKYVTDPSPAVRYPLLVLDEDILFCAFHTRYSCPSWRNLPRRRGEGRTCASKLL